MRNLLKIGTVFPALLAIVGAILFFYTQKYAVFGLYAMITAGVLGSMQLMAIVFLTPSCIDFLIAKLTKKYLVLEFNDSRVVKKYLADHSSGFVWIDEEKSLGYIVSSNNTVHFLDGVPIVVVYGTCGIACDIKALADLQQLSEIGWNKDKLVEFAEKNNISLEVVSHD
ncbi:MAG: hypothetical protein DRN30_06825 [Thermoplasmata archaeon]|nr:MAG: hypothetical protein DRN30_06825 [Thermoplasmata archaeon]